MYCVEWCTTGCLAHLNPMPPPPSVSAGGRELGRPEAGPRPAGRRPGPRGRKGGKGKKKGEEERGKKGREGKAGDAYGGCAGTICTRCQKSSEKLGLCEKKHRKAFESNRTKEANGNFRIFKVEDCKSSSTNEVSRKNFHFRSKAAGTALEK